ncbi:MAG: hypothetical protein ABJO67_07525 [Pseudoruegeria sp.]
MVSWIKLDDDPLFKEMSKRHEGKWFPYRTNVKGGVNAARYLDFFVVKLKLFAFVVECRC